jgi:hypothetical protein
MKSLITIGLCTVLSLTIYGCNKQPSSNASVTSNPVASNPVASNPVTSSSTAATPVTQQETSELPTATAPQNAKITNRDSGERTTSSITEGLYWLGGTDEGLEVQGDRYRYYSEGGEREWRSNSELKMLKAGVIFDGKVHWCLSTMKSKTASACSENGWVGHTAVAPTESRNMVEFRFFLRNDLEQLAREQGEAAVIQKEPRITRVLKLPCGAGAMAKVSQMPSPTGEELLSPDKVVEVDAQNNTLQRWAKPVDSQVIAIAGNRILVTADENRSYWIDPAGNITAYTETLSLPSPENVPYVKHPEFAPTGVYSQRFRDLNSGNDRRMIAVAPCT